MGLDEEGAHEMGSYWVPIYWVRVATKATSASLGEAKGNAEAAESLR